MQTFTLFRLFKFILNNLFKYPSLVVAGQLLQVSLLLQRLAAATTSTAASIRVKSETRTLNIVATRRHFTN